MKYSQTNIKLSQDTISRLKEQAGRYGFTYSDMCEKILEDGVSKLADENYFLLPDDGLRARIDITRSRSRSISNKENKNVKHHQYPQGIATHIVNQLYNGSDFSE